MRHGAGIANCVEVLREFRVVGSFPENVAVQLLGQFMDLACQFGVDM